MERLSSILFHAGAKGEGCRGGEELKPGSKRKSFGCKGKKQFWWEKAISGRK